MSGRHPCAGLDEVIHSPLRLSIMAALRPVTRMEFRLLRDTVEASDSLLSKHIAVPEQSGYVVVHKGYVGKRPRTWLSLSDGGRTAFAGYVDALRTLIDPAAGPAPSGEHPDGEPVAGAG